MATEMNTDAEQMKEIGFRNRFPFISSHRIHLCRTIATDERAITPGEPGR
jgi:hypothetical protein